MVNGKAANTFLHLSYGLKQRVLVCTITTKINFRSLSQVIWRYQFSWRCTYAFEREQDPLSGFLLFPSPFCLGLSASMRTIRWIINSFHLLVAIAPRAARRHSSVHIGEIAKNIFTFFLCFYQSFVTIRVVVPIF